MTLSRRKKSDPTGCGNTSDSSSEDFGGLLRKHRHKHRYNQTGLAHACCTNYSTISRVETGLQLPSQKEVDGFAKVLRLSDMDRQQFQRAFEQAVLKSKTNAATGPMFRPDDLVFYAQSGLQTIRSLRIEGKPQLAADLAQQHASKIRVFTRQGGDDSTTTELQSILAQLLMEQSKSYMDYVLPEETWSFVSSVIREQQEIAQYVGSAQFKFLADLSAEAAYYVSGNYNRAQQMCISLIDSRGCVHSEWQMELLRAVAINSGYLHDQAGVERASRLIDEFVDRTDHSASSELAFVLEGLARGQAAVKNINAMDTLGKAWEVLKKNQEQGVHSGLRRVQLIRTQLKTMEAIRTSAKTEFERMGQEALILCKALGYTRYETEITSLLNLQLNA